MLSNGACFYIDVSGAEYCTPEVTSAEEAVHRTYDGDRLVYGALSQLRQTGRIHSFQLNRRSADHAGTSRGIHHNFALPSSVEPTQYWDTPTVNALTATEIAKALIAGSGGLMRNKETSETQFFYSPRLALTNNLWGNDALADRGLLRKFISLDTGCFRYESICNDATNSPWALRASLVLMNSVLRLIEADMHYDLPRIYGILHAAHDVGIHGNNTSIELLDSDYENTLTVKPVDVLEEIVTQLIEAHEAHGILDSEMRQVLGEILDVAQLMRQDVELVAPVVEAVQRKLFLDKILSETVDYESTAMCRRDFLWDMIGDGVAQRVREEKGIGWLGFKRPYNINERKRRMTTAPRDTRATVRGRILSDQENYDGHEVMDWGTIIKDKTTRYKLHPLATNLKEAHKSIILPPQK